MRAATPSAVNLLRLAAIWNLVTSIYPPLNARNTSPGGAAWADLFSILNLGFGTGYLVASRDLRTFWPFVALGVAGKSAVAGIGAWHWWRGTGDAELAMTAAGEGTLAVLFWMLLRNHAEGGKMA
ncbi:hypothetical protein DFJ74DRAFT_288190 [Hyaloraphidium curvatum]|nr:hypothetical protein DFJ74DRAFT_288190 [Hyaloraphidium curvatum]